MKYIEPKIIITEFSQENIVTLSFVGNDPSAQSVFDAAGETGVTVAGAVDVGDILETN